MGVRCRGNQLGEWQSEEWTQERKSSSSATSQRGFPVRFSFSLTPAALAAETRALLPKAKLCASGQAGRSVGLFTMAQGTLLLPLFPKLHIDLVFSFRSKAVTCLLGYQRCLEVLE